MHVYMGAALVQVKDAEARLVFTVLEAEDEAHARDKHYLRHVSRWPDREVEFVASRYIPVVNGLAKYIAYYYQQYMIDNDGEEPKGNDQPFEIVKEKVNGS